MKQVRIVLALSLAACSTWRVETRPVAEVAATGGQRTVRLYLKSGERVQLFDATIVGDSVIGFTGSSQRDAQRVAVATSDVAQVEYLTTDSILTGLAVLGIVVLVVVGAAFATCASSFQG